MAELIWKIGFDEASAEKAGRKAGQAQEKSSKKSGGGSAFAGGFFGSILGSILSSVKMLFDPINAIATLLVAALFPILKPFLILFLKVGLLLIGWLNKLLGTESSVKGVTGTNEETGKTEVGSLGKKIALWGGVIVGALAMIAAAFAGWPAILVAVLGIAVVAIGKHLIEFGMLLGAKLADGVWWISTKIFEFTVWLGDIFANGIIWLGDVLSSAWESLKKLLHGLWLGLGNILSIMWLGLRTIFSIAWDALKKLLSSSWDLLKGFGQWIWDSLKNVLSTSFNVLKGIGQWIKDKIKSMFSFFGGGSKSVNDAIITPNGDVIRTSPSDYLIATKNPGSLGGGGSSNVSVTINGGLITEDVARQIGKIIQRELNYGGGF